MKRSIKTSGFTLLQLLVVVSIVGILTTLAVPSYQAYIDRARVTRAIGQLGEIELAIKQYAVANNGELPADLAEIGLDPPTDPWGQEYVYINLLDGGVPRTDHTAAAINTDYDLYSLGSDGTSATALTADESQDDILRGTDGGFFGLVSDYDRLP